MNPQTLANRANSSHFGHSDANRGEASRETVAKSASTTPVKPGAKDESAMQDGKSKKSAAPKSGNQATPTAKSNTPEHDATAQETNFKLEAAHAHEVLLAGCFTAWKKSAVKMVKGGGGVWHTKVSLKPGTYHYRYIVDGNWQDDPTHTQREANPYGSSDMVLHVA